MAKRLALYDKVEVDGEDLSNFAHSVQSASEHNKVDVSGFSASGANEYLAGSTEQGLTVEFFGSYETGEVHDVLYNLHRDRTIFPVIWTPDGLKAGGGSNPNGFKLEGNVQLLSYGPGASRGDADTFSVEFTAADENGLVWVQT